MEGEQDGDDGVFGEHDFTFDADPGHHLSPPRRRRGDAGRSGWRLLGQVAAVLLCLGGLTLVGFVAFILISLNSWGSNK